MKASDMIARLLGLSAADRDEIRRAASEWTAHASRMRCPICDSEQPASTRKQRINMWMLHRSLYGRRRCVRGY